MIVGILWPPPSQLFHSGGSPWLKCTPRQQQTWGWTAAACWLGYSGGSAGTHKPSLRQAENGDKSLVSVPPSLSPPEAPPLPKDISLSKSLRDFQQGQTPQDKAVLAQPPQKESHPFSPAKTTSASCAQKGFCCLVTQISGIRGSRAWSSILHLPPFHLHQLNALIKILSTVSPQGRIIISCTQTQYNSVFPGKPPPF